MRRKVIVIDSSKPLYVTRGGVIGGKEYKQDEVFDKDSVTDHDLNNLIHYRFLTDRAPDVEIERHETPAPAPQVAAAVPPPAPAPTASSEPKIVHKGGGYYEVVKNGIVISDGMALKGEEAAKKFVDEL